MKPLIVDLPYPTVTPQKDVHSAQVISFAYATLNGELTATLQYVYQHILFEEIDKDDADTLSCISLAEMMHFEMLGKAILCLGGNPKYVQIPKSEKYYTTQKVAQSTTPQKMLMDNIMGEMDTIANYKKMLFVLKNEQVSALIERIILDEQLHLQALKQMLTKYVQGTCNFQN